jgi:hypothetical protein
MMRAFREFARMVDSTTPTPSAPPTPLLVIRPLPDVVFLYPTLVAALLCGLVVQLGGASGAEPGATGIVFTIVFFVNLSMLAFEYTRMTAVALLLGGVILGLLAAMYPGLRTFVHDVLDQPMFMNATFYWVWSGGFGVLLLLVIARTRFDYWEINSNEIIHRRGLLGDVERWPAPNTRMSKEIKDVLEYALLRSGRLVLVPPGEQRAIVIDNVPQINAVEVEIQRVLSTLRVSHAE